MLTYLLKSGVCLTVFYLFYKLFLEKEPIHIFKRIYLLGGLLLAFAIPLITFTTTVEVEPIIMAPITYSEVAFEPLPLMEAEVATINYWPIILWTVYGFGVVLFGLKFLFNLYQIGSKIRKHPNQKANGLTHVLLQHLITPHTFFSYIFLNKKQYEQHKIPQEVFWHEETHAKQKHSLDVVLVELLQVVFWFNPLFYFIKKDIKLNHEFLADRAVLNKGVSLTAYQEILLTFSTNSTEPVLANALNYSSIKKRFTIMKTKTSKKAVWIKSLVLLPLVAVMIYGFSEKIEVVKEKPQTDIINLTKVTPIFIQMDGKGKLLVNAEKCNIEDLSKKLESITQEITDEQKKEIIINLKTETNTPETYISYAKEFIRISGFTKVSFNNTVNVENLKQDYIGAKFFRMVFYLDNDSQILVHGNWVKLSKFQNELNKYHNTKFKSLSEIELVVRNGIPKNTLSKTKSILNLYGDLKVKFTDSEPWGSPGPKQETVTNINQNKATPEEILEYNKLAKVYNKQPKDSRFVNLKDLNRLEFIFNKMTIKQKGNAEPYPDFPPPPPKQGETKSIPMPNEELAKVILKYNTLKAKQIANKNSTDSNNLTEQLESLEDRINEGLAEATKSITEKYQDKATAAEIAEYNKLAKHYNSMSKNNMVVKLKDAERLKFIYNKMTHKQKKNAESFPNFPPPPIKEAKVVEGKFIPPPPPIPADSTPEQKEKYNKAIENYKRLTGQTYRTEDSEIKQVIEEEVTVVQGYRIPPPPPPSSSQKTINKGSKELQKVFKKFSEEAKSYGLAVKNQKGTEKNNNEINEKYKKVMELHSEYAKLAADEGILPPPPPPPAIPPNPTDHMIEMAKKGALFYYEDKKITSDKAIELTKKNKSINIQILGNGSSKPIVQLSKKPITVE